MTSEHIQPQIVGILSQYAVRGVPQSVVAACEERRNSAAAMADGVASVNIDRVLTFCTEELPQDQVIRCVLDLGELFEQHGELGRAEEIYTFALAKSELHSEHSALGEALIRRGDVYCRLGRRRDSTADVTQGRKIYRTMNEELGVGRAETILGINYAVGGEVKKGETYLKRALNSFERLDDKLFSGIAHMNLGVVHRILGDHERCMRHFLRAQSTFEQLGEQSKLAEVHYKLGMTFLSTGDVDEALAEFEGCAALSANLADQRLRGLALYGKASAYYQRGDYRTALTFADMALDRFSMQDDRVHIANIYTLKGGIHRETEKPAFAHWYLYTSLRVHQEMENISAAGECYAELGKLHLVRGQIAEARRSFRKSVECFKEAGAVQEVKNVLTALQALKGKTGSELRRSGKAKV